MSEPMITEAGRTADGRTNSVTTEFMLMAERAFRDRGRAQAEYARLFAASVELLSAAKTVLAGLNARIDAAPLSAKPVFDGIADLHAAIMRAERLAIPPQHEGV